mmetsp:Transcript_9427/g.29454  ORF Transcript_9427/g.29454 Transcript_9427/m.29454 type:complete len:213 (+) Transcript_9427:15-653(+)
MWRQTSEMCLHNSAVCPWIHAAHWSSRNSDTCTKTRRHTTNNMPSIRAGSHVYSTHFLGKENPISGTSTSLRRAGPGVEGSLYCAQKTLSSGACATPSASSAASRLLVSRATSPSVTTPEKRRAATQPTSRRRVVTAGLEGATPPSAVPSSTTNCISTPAVVPSAASGEVKTGVVMSCLASEKMYPASALKLIPAAALPTSCPLPVGVDATS